MAFRSYLPFTLNNLLSRLTNAKAAGVEFNFGKKLDEAEEVLPSSVKTFIAEESKQEAKLGHASITTGETTLTSEKAERFLTTYEVGTPLPPAYIVTQAWLRFEEEVQLYLQFQGIELQDRRRSTSFMLKLLNNDGLFSQDELDQLSELRTLRNIVSHNTDTVVTRTDALRYSNIVNSLIERLRSKRLPPLT